MHEGLLPSVQSFRALLDEMDLPVAIAKRHQVAVVTPVEETRARILLHFTLPIGEQIESVDIDLEGLLTGAIALLELRHDVRLPGRSQESGEHVLVRENVVVDNPCLDHTGPPDQAGHSPCTLPIRVFLAS